MHKSTSAKQRQGLATKAENFLIGNDLSVTRLGFGAMRITGRGIWGEPASGRAEAVRVLPRASLRSVARSLFRSRRCKGGELR